MEQLPSTEPSSTQSCSRGTSRQIEARIACFGRRTSAKLRSKKGRRLTRIAVNLCGEAVYEQGLAPN